MVAARASVLPASSHPVIAGIDLRPLKEEVRAERAPGDPLREALLAEPDEVSPLTFAAKIRPWLVLLRMSPEG